MLCCTWVSWSLMVHMIYCTVTCCVRTKSLWMDGWKEGVVSEVFNCQVLSGVWNDVFLSDFNVLCYQFDRNWKNAVVKRTQTCGRCADVGRVVEPESTHFNSMRRELVSLWKLGFSGLREGLSEVQPAWWDASAVEVFSPFSPSMISLNLFIFLFSFVLCVFFCNQKYLILWQLFTKISVHFTELYIRIFAARKWKRLQMRAKTATFIFFGLKISKM